MKKNLITAVLYTVATTVLLGLVYPLVVTAVSQMLFKDKANGQLLQKNGVVIGSAILAQPFSGAAIFSPTAFSGRDQRLRREQFLSYQLWSHKSEAGGSCESRCRFSASGKPRQAGSY